MPIRYVRCLKIANIASGWENGTVRLKFYSSDLDFQGILTEEGIIAKSGRPLSGVPYHIMQDSRGNIWIATKGDGIILAERRGHILSLLDSNMMKMIFIA